MSGASCRFIDVVIASAELHLMSKDAHDDIVVALAPDEGRFTLASFDNETAGHVAADRSSVVGNHPHADPMKSQSAESMRHDEAHDLPTVFRRAIGVHLAR